MNKLLVNHKADIKLFTPMGNSESSVNLTCMSLDGGWTRAPGGNLQGEHAWSCRQTPASQAEPKIHCREVTELITASLFIPVLQTHLIPRFKLYVFKCCMSNPATLL